MPSPVIACVDLGTNTCLMLVARRTAHGVEVLSDRASIIRLGQGVDAARRLHPDARARALKQLTEYAAEARSLGATQLHLVATSAMRDAVDGPEFAEEITRVTGFHARIIHGEEEASLSWESAVADFGQAGVPLAVFDVGGGSTEVMFSSSNRRSINVGSVRLTERFLGPHAPTDEEMRRLEAHVKEAFAGVPPLPPGTSLVGLAGTVTNLAACARNLPTFEPRNVHGGTLALEDVVSLKQRLAALAPKDRLSIRPLEAGRADVIVAGAVVVEQVMRACGVSVVRVSDGGVRHGLFLRLAGA
jgi:exopolyphosphatase/guanosine-5'-triphosphate,3'-diphosphate pyrophosphatase